MLSAAARERFSLNRLGNHPRFIILKASLEKNIARRDLNPYAAIENAPRASQF